MDTLTKKYFDQHIKRIESRFDSVESRFDLVERNMKKKIEDEIHGLAMMTAKGFNDLDKKIEDEIHGLAMMTAKGFDDLDKRLDVRDRVDKLEKKMTKVESALNVQL